jgi:acetoin utilization deacetylase AcuC-like enzyme
MNTLFVSHTDCEKHVMLEHHPESPARLQSIHKALATHPLHDSLEFLTAREIAAEHFSTIHPRNYLAMLEELDPGEGIARIDADTSLNKHSLRAARLAAGGVIQAVEAVMQAKADNAFCAVRPPGHHAESAIGMGFCIFNNVALAAERALTLGAERVAIVDFDVHHGNGSVEIFLERPEVMVCSSFQFPFYPGRYDEVIADHIVLTPLAEATSSSVFRQAIERDWLPALARHQPDIILVSAGFDAHRDDTMAGLLLEDADYAWITGLLKEAADRLCNGRLVSTLEGGYQLDALARCVMLHLQELNA